MKPSKKEVKWYTKVCRYGKCSKPFKTKRQKQEFCSHRCRQADWQERKYLAIKTGNGSVLEKIRAKCQEAQASDSKLDDLDGGCAYFAREILEIIDKV